MKKLALILALTGVTDLSFADNAAKPSPAGAETGKKRSAQKLLKNKPHF